jgi:hypothetical protein
LALISAVLWAGLAQPALAADCASIYTIDALLDDLVQIEEFLRNGDGDAAGTVGKKLEAGLGCLAEVLPSMIAGRSYRAVAASYIASGDPDTGMPWFLTATEIDQGFDYGLEDLPEEHPVRGIYLTAKTESDGEKVAVDGMGWATGKNYLDGRKIDKPAARLGRPHIYQREDGDVQTWRIDGNDFPVEVLSAAVAVAAAPDSAGGKGKGGKGPKPAKESKVKEPKPDKVPKPDKDPKPDKVKKPKPSQGTGGSVTVTRQRPAEKTPLIIGGGAVIGGAGAVYLMALSSRGKFERASTQNDIATLQTTTNRLVMVSAATLAVGAGTFTWGVILDGSSPLPAIKFRF